MNFFYDLNKRLNELAAPKETLNEGSCGSMGEAGYSAKAARAGKDIGKPGKQFAKIAKSAGERYGSQERGEKVAGAVLKKLRAKESVEESDVEEMFHYDMPAGKDRGPRDHGTDELSRRAEVAKRMKNPLMTDPSYKDKDRYGDRYKIAGPKGRLPEGEMDEGNEFSGALAKARATGSATFKVDGKTYRVTEAELDEREFDNKDTFDRQAKPGDTYRGHKGTITKTRTGYTHHRRHEEEPELDKDHDEDDKPKAKGRPKGTRRAIGAKGPTGRSKLLKKDAIKETGVEEDYDRDEYDEEGEMAKSQSRTIADAAMELQDILGDNENLPEWVQKKINLAQEYIDSVRDYLKSNRPGDEMVAEKAVSRAQRKAAGIARAAQKGDIPRSELRGASKAMARMPAGELKKFAKTKEKGLPRRANSQEVDERLDSDAAADQYLKMAAADLGATQASMKNDDEWNSMSDRQQQKTLSRERNRRAGIRRAQDKIIARSKSPTKKSVREVDTSDAGAGKTAPGSKKHNEKVFAQHRERAKKERDDHDKEKSVKETTTSGSVAPATDTPKKSKGGVQYGKGIYDSFNREVENLIAESMNVSMNVSSEGQRSVTVTATDEDATKLASLLKMAGVGGAMGSDEHVCPSCGGSPCGCASQVDENQPDWPTNTETSADALQYSGGLNKPKRDVAGDGQSTVPVASVRSADEDDLDRLREMAGISEAARPDFLDIDKDGDKEEPMKKAAKEKEHDDEAVQESILDMSRLWKAYQG